jgi:beta-carotene/zeaxanthin 4-ketolase
VGILIAIVIILSWAVQLFYSLSRVEISFVSPLFYLHFFLQVYLFTGLFITGHDAMHGTVSRNRFVNQAVGYLSAFLYAGMFYRRLIRYHGLHHQYPATEKDPDYSVKSRNFFVWWFRFMLHYVTWIQLVIMAVLFNLLQIMFPVSSILWFWVIPAILSTFQLFYFGTFIPHSRPHTDQMGPHRARTLKKGHLLAMLSCYFFGYHREHHESPRTPWWQLYRLKSLPE